MSALRDRPTEETLSELFPGIVARERPGLGETVFWIHGYTLDSSLWAPLWDLLPEFGHIGIDMPGHGASAALSAGETLAGLGAKLAAAALERGARHVVGLSLGSMLALQLALARPRGFATLCLGAPALAGGPTDADVGRRYVEMARAHAEGERGAALRRRWMRSPPDLFRHAEADRELWERLAAAVDRHPWSEFAGPGVARLATGTQPLSDVAQLACRTLLMVGEYEFPAFKETAGLLDARIPDCRIAVLSGVGHLSMIEAPVRAAELLRGHWTDGRSPANPPEGATCSPFA